MLKKGKLSGNGIVPKAPEARHQEKDFLFLFCSVKKTSDIGCSRVNSSACHTLVFFFIFLTCLSPAIALVSLIGLDLSLIKKSEKQFNFSAHRGHSSNSSSNNGPR